MRYLRYLFIGACLFAGTPGFAQSQAPVSPAPDYAVLRAQSAALSKADRARAKQLFATAFTLWQSGDFAAAEIGFKKGLEIDPANGVANYYYGDSLVRRNDRKSAKDYLSRAVAFGGDTQEGLKAQAELQTTNGAPGSVADMSADDVRAALIGHWTISNDHGPGTLSISDIQDGKMILAGYIPGDIGGATITDGFVAGDNITFHSSTWACTMTYSGTLRSPTHIEGKIALTCSSDVFVWTADKH